MREVETGKWANRFQPPTRKLETMEVEPLQILLILELLDQL